MNRPAEAQRTPPALPGADEDLTGTSILSTLRLLTEFR